MVTEVLTGQGTYVISLILMQFKTVVLQAFRMNVLLISLDFSGGTQMLNLLTYTPEILSFNKIKRNESMPYKHGCLSITFVMGSQS